MKRSAARKAFTLMELLVVIAILLVLAAVATPMYLSYLEQSRYDKVKAEVQSLAQDIKQWNLRNRDTALGELGPNDWSKLRLEKGQINNAGQPLDPWGQVYQFAYAFMTDESGITTKVPVVWSLGPTGQFNAGHELSSAPNLANLIQY
jgi:prepilin-type N-terminal cleavage/methylation domain-containing protein